MSSEKNNSEEIDLNQLFQLIGNVFNKIFLFIAGFFKGIFDVIISFLQFIRIHFLKFVIVCAIGIIIGWYLDVNAKPIYRSSMIVEPNFNSTQQLYKNIEFYNELAIQRENLALGQALKISDSAALKIVLLNIESFTDETQKIKQFSEFIKTIDSSSRELINFDYYIENFNYMTSKFHKISIESTDPEVAKKCQNAIVKSIENNNYFKVQKEVNHRNIALSDSIIDKQFIEIDSLQKFYKKIKILEANKATGSNNVTLAETKSEYNSEIELLAKVRQLNKNKIILNNRRANTENTINIISDFPNKGALVNDFISKKTFQIPILFILILFFILILIELNKYLKKL